MIPWRIKDQFNAHIGNGRNDDNFLLSVLDEDFAHAATRCGQRHVDADGSLAILAWNHIQAIDQTEIDNVDWNLGVVAGLQLLPDNFLDVLVGGVFRYLRGRYRLLA